MGRSYSRGGPRGPGRASTMGLDTRRSFNWRQARWPLAQFGGDSLLSLEGPLGELRRIDQRQHDGHGSSVDTVGSFRHNARQTNEPQHPRGPETGMRREPYRDRMHYLSNAGTAYAILALDACGEIDVQ